ncbi:glucan endo-1,3-beta-glucosidase 8-like [Sesamum indicum]|uniref:Glucan endo-1,3-beta-glucosidase 8-like n=1 Tax=Sesamum indicum TaxID=4182 RepID=A0A6I9UKL0_SESIN|nr:glucan endo-1,3-beta-glucosidase 8-like [Sesamum indicum]
MAEGSIIGVNWGRQTSHRLIPSMVVDLLLQNNIRHLKLFSASGNVLMALSGADIAITVTMPNENLQHLFNRGLASYWLQEKVRKYQTQNVNIRYVHIGNEPFSKLSHESLFTNVTSSLRYIQEMIVRNGYENVTATTPHYTDVLKPGIKKPSEAEFRPDIMELMVEFVTLLNTSKAPFVVNMFPLIFNGENNWDPEFAFIDNKSNFTIQDDNGLVYTNVFEFIYDSFLHAIKKAGGPDVELTVGQIGWPTDGYPGATSANAERFFGKLLPFVKSSKGTPLRPGISIEVYIHTLVDENLHKIKLGAFRRHWGVYNNNGQPKYKIDFTGQGRDMYPTSAKGVVLMPKRWCVYNGNIDNEMLVQQMFDYACQEADCTPLAPGGSCQHLDPIQNVSYAFNRYFQNKAQYNEKTSTCDFGGLGKVVLNDPSVGTCKFPIEILAAESAETKGLNSGGERLRGWTLLLPLVSMIGIYAVHV